MMRAMCGVQLKERKRAKDLMSMLALNETVDQLDVVNNVCWHRDVLRRNGRHVFRWKFGYYVEDQGR